ncbi:NAD-dependent malic enzyme [Legionella israelensis]|uniref:Malolactic enzyme n=1 Tax=Legionella israelensis TaxID=454 RepID=A0A0W0V4J9_9GAMM|nr:NAD-dependent malic enzyme [Legionella israelensis]KTD15041.1 malate dehydrogenase [Legionella israelensis]QBS10207.1 NAD-dependent malic enzyme [Legionella israelensis]SCY20415.1 NAD-dependent malic enzyme [Legionella israelensis DSM 19235]STX59800.1 malate dehydrogenase [Legionella israelensis]
MALNVNLRGPSLLRDPLLNKSTAFTANERDRFELNGLLPPHIETIEEQLVRCYEAYSIKQDQLEKHIYLRALQDHNETLFYRLILTHIEEMMPIIYTPVVGEACQKFHRIYRQPRGVFLNYPERNKIERILSAIAAHRDVRVIVVTDGERILGLGDQGSGGLGIPIGKLSLYTACGGIHPANTLPVILDVGTNNQEKLDDPEYLGWRHERISGNEYDEFVDSFVQGVKKHFPKTLLQFEDFAQLHAYPLLKRYQDQLCTFNDDIQGTAAVTVAAIVAATKVAGETLKDQRIALLGAGSAGCGISEQLVQVMIQQGLTESEARSRFYLVDRVGLLHDKIVGLLPFQQAFAQPYDTVKNWQVSNPDNISLEDVIHQVKPTILLGVSGQPNQFSKSMIEKMFSYCKRPIVLPLSNPTSRAEAIPEDVLNWTDGQALVATGSPFEPVNIHGHHIDIAQCNNAYIFPGVGLGVVASKAKRVSDKMMMAAAIALSELAPAMKTGEGRLLPELINIRQVSRHIAKAVIQQGIKENHIYPLDDLAIEQKINETMWYPDYQVYS